MDLLCATQNAIENEMAEMRRDAYATYEAFRAEAIRRAIKNVYIYSQEFGVAWSSLRKALYKA